MGSPGNDERAASTASVTRFVRRVGRGVSIMLYGCIGAIFLAIVLFVIYIPLVVLGIAPIPGACITEVKNITDLSGYDFEIRETNCNVIAKDASVSVSIAASGSGEKKEILFKYDPGVYDPSSPPTVEMPRPGIVLLSVPIVSSVFLQVEIWRDLSIDYRIGRVLYASGSERTKPVRLRESHPPGTQ
jgi:hypothetical protein